MISPMYLERPEAWHTPRMAQGIDGLLETLLPAIRALASYTGTPAEVEGYLLGRLFGEPSVNDDH